MLDVPAAGATAADLATAGDGCLGEKTPAEGGEQRTSLDNVSVSAFLDSIGLPQLTDIFEREQISTDILLEMGHDELKVYLIYCV